MPAPPPPADRPAAPPERSGGSSSGILDIGVESFPPRGAPLFGDGPLRPSIPLRFSFTGTGREYFGIWIVNVLLTIVTLGIYTPWAKVRRRIYFHGNTTLAGASFQYLGDPLVILKGWIVAALFFLAYTLGARLHPAVKGAALILFMAVMPWIVVRSRMFNLRNTSHRGIRFGFRPNYREAYAVLLGFSLLIPLTLGMLAPYADYRRRKFIIENSSYGKTPFRFAGIPRDFYMTYLKGIGLFVALLFGAVIILYILFSAHFIAARTGGRIIPGGRAAFGLSLASIVAIYACLLVAGVYLRTNLANLTYGAVHLGPVRFRSTLSAWTMIGLYLSNAVAIAVTLGLFVPWARMRLARYRCGCLAAKSTEEIDGFLASVEPDVGASGEEIGDILDIDISL